MSTTNTTVTTSTSTKNFSGPNLTSIVPFDQVCEPGAYVCSWNGHLIRVTEECFTSAGTPGICMVGPEPLFVTKICNNPFVTLTQARLLACNFDISVNF